MYSSQRRHGFWLTLSADSRTSTYKHQGNRLPFFEVSDRVGTENRHASDERYVDGILFSQRRKCEEIYGKNSI